MMPFATQGWTAAERGDVFGEAPWTPSLTDYAVRRMRRANCTHLALVDSRAIDRFAKDSRFDLEYRAGRYSVFSLRDAVSRWGRAADGSPGVLVDRIEPGRMRVRLAGPMAGGHIDVAEAYHPFWRTEPPSVASIRAAPDGLMIVGPLAPDVRAFELVYDPPALPTAASLLGASIVLATFMVSALRRRRARLARAHATGASDAPHSLPFLGL
jgi:hypothetical protein